MSVVVKPVTCPVCGCLCDDIEVTVENGKITKVRNGCVFCVSKFLNYSGEHRILTPLIRESNKHIPVSYDQAIEKAAQILVDAKYPILYGWSSTSCESQRVGVRLAEEVGGVIDNTCTVCHGPSLQSVQDAGLPGCTLGQVRHRADLIIYWGCNPLSSHLRHLTRYTACSKGRFTEGDCRERFQRRGNQQNGQQKNLGELYDEKSMAQRSSLCDPTDLNNALGASSKGDRIMVVVDVRMTQSANLADFFIQVEPGKDYELLQALRVLVKGKELEVDNVSGVPVDCLEELADVMLRCNFGVIFFGLGLTMTLGKQRNSEVAIRLVSDLNNRTKFAIMPMRGHFNVAGANAVLAWTTGYPYAVDFSMGYPRYNPGETTVVDILSRGESDAALVIGADPGSNLPTKIVQRLLKNPLIVIDPHRNVTAMMGDVVFPSAFVGIETDGTAYRMDNVPLPLKKVLDPPKGMLSDKVILERILQRVKEMKVCQKTQTVKRKPVSVLA
jgi:formylmethanofuran dehydrogenase subunit B